MLSLSSCQVLTKLSPLHFPRLTVQYFALPNLCCKYMVIKGLKIGFTVLHLKENRRILLAIFFQWNASHLFIIVYGLNITTAIVIGILQLLASYSKRKEESMLVLKCFITTAIVLQLFGVWYVCDREPYTGYWNYITAEHIPVIIKFRCLCFVFFEKIKHSVCWLNC